MSNCWKKGIHREETIDRRCPYCKVKLDSYVDENSLTNHVHGCNRKRKAEELRLSSHNTDYSYYHKLEGTIHSPLLIQGSCESSSSSKVASPDMAALGALGASRLEGNDFPKSKSLGTAIPTHHRPGDMVQHLGPSREIMASSIVSGMQSSIRPADTSIKSPPSQVQNSPPHDRSPSIPEPEKTLPPKKRVRLTYKNKLVCNFSA